MNTSTRHRCIVLLFALLVCGVRPAAGQILQGEWVDATQAAIEQHRKTEVLAIVLDDQDRAIRGATVRFVQKRHDFALGLTIPSDRMPPADARQRPVYRCFNTIALDRYTDWATADAAFKNQSQRLAAWHEAIGPLRICFGRVVSADPARNHDRLALLEASELQAAVLARVDRANEIQPTADHYGLYADLLQQDLLERKLGQGMLHRLFYHARSKRPDASFGLRVRQTIDDRRGRELLQKLQRLELRQVPFDHVTIEQSFTEDIQPEVLQHIFNDTLTPLTWPITLAELEVAGSTPFTAATNIEAVLRLAFARPNIQGITFAGLTENDFLEDHAALIDEDGNPTGAGLAMDQLFTELWHSDETVQTDERGNAQARVFSGWYNVTATLPDGTVMTTDLYLPKSERAKRVVLQQTQADGP